MNGDSGAQYADTVRCGEPTLLWSSWMKALFTLVCDKPKGHRGRHIRPAQYDGLGRAE